MRYALLALCLFLLLPASNAYWAETLRVKVLTPLGYGVPDATVEVMYQKQVSIDLGGRLYPEPGELDGKIVGKTNSEGIFEVGLIDYVEFGETQFYYVKVGKEQRRTYVGENRVNQANEHVFFMDAPIHRVILRVRDAFSRSLANASVTATCGDMISQGLTDSGGIYSFFVQTPTTCEVNLLYGTISYTEAVHNIEEDVTANMNMPVYDLSVIVVDESGEPLDVPISVSGFPMGTTDEAGRYTIKQFPDSTAYVTVVHQNRQQVTQVELRSNQPITITFDLTPPSISNINHTLDDSGIAYVRVTVVDPGADPSAISGVSLRYSTNRRDWKPLQMYPVSAYNYEATIPAQEPGTRVFYIVEALDAYSNNAVSEEYQYRIPEEQGGGNGGGGFVSLSGIWYILIPLIVLLAVILFRLKTD
ncbi:hypothetical protein DRN67_02595 [Candidatus Micrarchaeota archaeon]|nr:MAG: hypothetical protein DRN67_02595 [Candidatus Micrarchaeota archaeon]